MRCPFADWKPVGNHGGLMRSHRGLVVHVQEGNGSLAGYFNNPASQVSAHFWAAKDGRLEQYVDSDSVAWAQAGGNPDYLSVETEGFAREFLTEQQIATLGRLLAWVHASYGVPLVGPVRHGQSGLTTHSQPDGIPDPLWGNHPCPGTRRLGQLALVLAAAGSEPQPAPRAQGRNMIAHDNVTGGNWIVRSNGNVYAFDGAPYIGPLPKFTAQWGIGTAANPVVGICSDGGGGFVLAADGGGPQPATYHITADGRYAR
jgi:N-acetylmuramoyl-L-alanine amidase